MSANEPTKRSKWAAWRDTMLQSETWRVTVHFMAWIVIVPALATSTLAAWITTRAEDHRLREFLLAVLLLPFYFPLGLLGAMVNSFLTIPGAFLTFAFAWRMRTAFSRWMFALCGVAVGMGWTALLANRLGAGKDDSSLIVIGALAGFLLGKITTALWCSPKAEAHRAAAYESNNENGA